MFTYLQYVSISPCNNDLTQKQNEFQPQVHFYRYALLFKSHKSWFISSSLELESLKHYKFKTLCPGP